MYAASDDLDAAIETDAVTVREAVWGDMHVAFEGYAAEFDTAPLMRGLPDDRCQCPHWGYVVDGRMRVDYGDRGEAVDAGEAYFLEPGHLVTHDAGTEVVEFSPADEYAATMAVVEGNLGDE